MNDIQETGTIDLPRKRIPRKPVHPKQNWVGLPPGLAHVQTPTEISPEETIPDDDATLVNDVQDLSIEDVKNNGIPSSTVGTGLTDSTLVASEEAETVSEAVNGQAPGQSKLAKAWEETKYFAGGLVPHPAESTKHYSVLRHSHGIVYYQGPATSIAISIFADRPLPSDRRLWLQQKGWTGSAGWKAKQLFRANGGWLDVTPSVEATADQLPNSCERAWQRDCRKYWQKEGYKRNHQLRETCIIRIPCEAEDGYFRIVLCGDGKAKNKLCPSPVFRVASAGTAPSSIKGASLSTLPLEAGIKILSMVANNAAMNAIQPVTTAVQGAVGQFMPNFWEREAVSTAYGATGIKNKINSANGTYQSVRDTNYQHVGGVDGKVYEALDQAPMIGDDSGPSCPYPIAVSSTIVSGSGNSSRLQGRPTANLKYVREEVTMSLHGVYFGWGRVTPSKALQKELGEGHNEFYPIWHPAIIDISIVPGVPLTVIYGAKKAVSAYLIHDFHNLVMANCSIELVIMGFLRGHTPPLKFGENAEERAEQDSDDSIADIAITQASLARPAWAIEAVYKQRGWKAERGELDEGGSIKNLTQSMTEGYIGARQAAQRQVDRVPVHRLGVRRQVDTLREQALGRGGIYVLR